ncbi:MAG TPA: FKBP-type peptidyl-prolyl cis-trans isomerase [Ktedonobacteraceae bacterium]
MPQTVNGQDTSEEMPQDEKPQNEKPREEKGQKEQRAAATTRTRPGQRQQERMQRLARRRKRRRIISASIAAVLLVVAGLTAEILYNNYTYQQGVLHENATSTADARAHATSTMYANATATVVSKNCFLSANGEAVPSVYAGDKAPSSGPTTAPLLKGTATTTKDGLKYVDIKVGTGAAVTEGKTVTANYTGWLASTCQKFDSSYDAHGTSAAAPFSTQLSTSSLIPGWVEGMAGMKAGGIRRMYIPSKLAYGAQGQGSIPANADLIFDVQLISFK